MLNECLPISLFCLQTAVAFLPRFAHQFSPVLPQVLYCPSFYSFSLYNIGFHLTTIFKLVGSASVLTLVQKDKGTMLRFIQLLLSGKKLSTQAFHLISFCHYYSKDRYFLFQILPLWISNSCVREKRNWITDPQSQHPQKAHVHLLRIMHI